MKRSLLLLCAVVTLSTALAAPPDLSGLWKWVYERNGEPLDIEMTVKQDGSKLTGTIASPDGRELKIQDGKVSEAGLVDFHIEFPRDNGPLKIHFHGKVANGNLQGTSHYITDDGEKREREWNPKRVRNLTGKWTSSFKRSNGDWMETTLDLKQTGHQLTGTQSFNEFEREIEEGKIQGDDVSFKTVWEREGRTVTTKYLGKIQKDQSIKGHLETDWTGELQRRDWQARRTK